MDRAENILPLGGWSANRDKVLLGELLTSLDGFDSFEDSSGAVEDWHRVSEAGVVDEAAGQVDTCANSSSLQGHTRCHVHGQVHDFLIVVFCHKNHFQNYCCQHVSFLKGQPEAAGSLKRHRRVHFHLFAIDFAHVVGQIQQCI